MRDVPKAATREVPGRDERLVRGQSVQEVLYPEQATPVRGVTERGSSSEDTVRYTRESSPYAHYPAATTTPSSPFRSAHALPIRSSSMSVAERRRMRNRGGSGGGAPVRSSSLVHSSGPSRHASQPNANATAHSSLDVHNEVEKIRALLHRADAAHQSPYRSSGVGIASMQRSTSDSRESRASQWS